jgi:hypothetical protein
MAQAGPEVVALITWIFSCGSWCTCAVQMLEFLLGICPVLTAWLLLALED